MEPVTLAVVLTDNDSMITGLEGATDRFGLSADCVGQSWADAFHSWDMPPLANGIPQRPRHVKATAPTGLPVTLEFFPLPSKNGHQTFATVINGHESGSLTDRQQQLCALGEISAGVAHEINNALTLSLIHI